MKQSTQLKLGQSQTMAPQLQQAIRLLQLSSVELSVAVQDVLDSNMMLELDERTGFNDVDDSTVEVEDNEVHVEMTLTAQGCGMGPYIAQQAEWRIAEIEEVEDVVVDLVFEPQWTPELITEDGKRLLGID